MARRDRRTLEEYRRKRRAGATAEPFGGGADGGTGLFVVHEHAARSLHYDLRLEIDGALHSWAVPKGPSLDPTVKRLAMEVEDHPLEYGDFEGVIPPGNYGAGSVIVWDRGRWVNDGDARDGLERGKLLFELHGHKLRGRWTLFKTTSAPNSWILMKKPDAFADPTGDAPPSPSSVLSGLDVTEIADGGARRRAALGRALRRSGAPRAEVDPWRVEPMLARAADEPFSRRGWLFELKYDGYRVLAATVDGRTALRLRNGGDATSSFPEIVAVLEALPFEGVVLDGELVVLDTHGRPDFGLLQRRAAARGPTGVPAVLYAFDLLACAGHDLRPLSLADRRRFLRRVVPAAGAIRVADAWPTRGEALWAEATRLGFEGVVAKDAAAPYRGGRGDRWLKIRHERSGTFAIVGIAPGRRRRPAPGALHLAAREGDGWRWVGRVASGLTAAALDRLAERCEASRQDRAPCAGAPDGADHRWCEPGEIGEVRFRAWTAAGRLRHPVFVRLRDDVGLDDCEWVRGDPAPPPAPPEPTAAGVVETNRDKRFWPEDGYTKGDLLDYHARIAPRMLPWLRDRPLVMTRYPDGVDGKHFFQKDAPAFAPGWLRTETIWSEHAGRELRYIVCDDERSLRWVVNLGTIPIHVWASRLSSVQHPDWSILDLDPGGAPWTDVVRLARAARRLCEEIGLPAYLKTSGASGLHVLVPLGGRCTFEQSRMLAELLARVLIARHPAIATVARSRAARDGKVYVDFLQNGHGKLLVAPYSVRPLPGAPVSTPLRWSELRAGLDPARFTIRGLPGRVARQRADPWAGLLDERPDLGAALERLADVDGVDR